MTAGHSPRNRPRRTPRAHPASPSPWWRRLLKSWLAWLGALVTAVITAMTISIVTGGAERVVSSPSSKRPGPTSSSPQRSREAWAQDVNRTCGKYVRQLGKDYDTIRIAGLKIVKRSQELQKFRGDPAEGIQDYFADIERFLNDAFPAFTRTDSTYRTIESEIGALSWPTRSTDESLARGWWNLYRERTKKFAEVYIASGNFLVNNPSQLRPALFAQLATALTQYQKISEDFYARGSSLGIDNCR
ncbi:MAG TPA: hypothetical protein VFU43_12740 [Streptosporangiaceae bacterium]|nr:hypothetical protein [Streptosporangiaceae bacterium]